MYAAVTYYSVRKYATLPVEMPLSYSFFKNSSYTGKKKVPFCMSSAGTTIILLLYLLPPLPSGPCIVCEHVLLTVWVRKPAGPECV